MGVVIVRVVGVSGGKYVWPGGDAPVSVTVIPSLKAGGGSRDVFEVEGLCVRSGKDLPGFHGMYNSVSEIRVVFAQRGYRYRDSIAVFDRQRRSHRSDFKMR